MPLMRSVLLVAVVAVAGHDATYLLAHGVGGYADAMAATGHDRYWAAVALGVVATLGAAIGAAGIRWWGLRRQLRRHRITTGDAELTIRWRDVLVSAARIGLVAMAVFVVQEQVEAASVGAGGSGLAVLLAPGIHVPLIAFGVVAVVFATLSHLVGMRIERLARQLALARAGLPRAARGGGRRPFTTDATPRRAVTADPVLGRAPPVMAGAPH